MTVLWSRPLDVGDEIRTGDGPQNRLSIWSLLPGTGQVNVMDAYGRMRTVDANWARSYRVGGEAS